MASIPELAILMALRVRGRADPDQVARAAGCSAAVAREALAELAAGHAVTPHAATPGAVALTDAGRASLARLLADEPVDRAALATRYARFLAADRDLKAAITAWQLAPDAQRPAARSTVMASATSACAVAAALVELAPRLAPYAARIAEANAAIAAGDARFVANPRVDSLHQVWFELHEDLLVTLGRSRGT